MAVSTEESTTEFSTFEGTFLRGLKVDEAFRAELKQKLGIDLQRPEPRYPTRLWRDALDLAVQRYFANRDPNEARRELGRVALEGFLSTISGRFMGAALSTLIGPEALMKRMPKFFQLARPGLDVTAREEAKGQWRGVWRDPYPDPYFTLGLVEGAGKRTKATFTGSVARSAPDGFELVFLW